MAEALARRGAEARVVGTTAALERALAEAGDRLAGIVDARGLEERDASEPLHEGLLELARVWGRQGEWQGRKLAVLTANGQPVETVFRRAADDVGFSEESAAGTSSDWTIIPNTVRSPSLTIHTPSTHLSGEMRKTSD